MRGQQPTSNRGTPASGCFPRSWDVFPFFLSADGYFPAISSLAPWQKRGWGGGGVGTGDPRPAFCCHLWCHQSGGWVGSDPGL